MRLFCETFGLVDTTSLLSLQRLKREVGFEMHGLFTNGGGFLTFYL